MDTTAERQKLENEERAIKQYLEHPISRRIIEDNNLEIEKAVSLICEAPIDSIEAFFNHFQAVGHLRGLRRAASIIQDDVEDIKAQLENIPQ